MMILNQDGDKLYNWNAIEGLEIIPHEVEVDSGEEDEDHDSPIYTFHYGIFIIDPDRFIRIGSFENRKTAESILARIMRNYEYFGAAASYQIPDDE